VRTPDGSFYGASVVALDGPMSSLKALPTTVFHHRDAGDDLAESVFEVNGRKIREVHPLGSAGVTVLVFGLQ